MVTGTASSSSQPEAAAAPKLTLSGGEPHHSTLAAFWRDSRFTDITVCAEGVECKAHRIVLASSSGYFLGLFDSGMRDGADTTHTLEGMRAPVFKAVLAFVYEGSCEIEEGLLTEVLEASARLVVDALKEACVDAIGERLAPSNALDAWRLADVFTLPVLEKAAVEAALRGFEELPAQLATGAVLAVAQDDRLVAKSEETVFQWCVRWWEAAERPEAELLAVMKHVRFAAMAEEFLRETVDAWPALQSVGVQSMLSNAVLPAVDGTKPVPLWGFGPRLIYVVGGRDDNERLSTMELYDPYWKQLANNAGSRASHSCVALDGKLYSVGGLGAKEVHDSALSSEPWPEPGGLIESERDVLLRQYRWVARALAPAFFGSAQALDTAEVYDPQTDGWQPLANMTTARAGCVLAAVSGKIYAIGGCGGNGRALDSVEAYDPQLGTWALVASMNSKRMYHASAVLDGKIYIMGGQVGADLRGTINGTFDTVEAYDPQVDSWQQVASMPRSRSKHAAAAMGGKIYVTGGTYQGGSYSLNSVNVYDPQTDAWVQLANTKPPWVVLDGKIYTVPGGYATVDPLSLAPCPWPAGGKSTSNVSGA